MPGGSTGQSNGNNNGMSPFGARGGMFGVPGGGRFNPSMFRGGSMGSDMGGGPSAFGGHFPMGGTMAGAPNMGNPGAQPQMPPGNPMTGNTTVNPGSPNPVMPMAGNYGILSQMLGMGGMGGFMGGGANSAGMNPLMAMLFNRQAGG